MSNADTPCSNCGCDFADHEYIKDSIDQYECPYPEQDSSYGFFNGGDPRDFCPDHECCTAEEIASHKEACEAFLNADRHGLAIELVDCPSGFEDVEGGRIHVLRAPYGIGTQTYSTVTYFEPVEYSETANSEDTRKEAE
jgi:sarcosine oxidase delta subunit